jgi:threonine/homoserine/homoserine lactone efflux protein
MTLHVWLAFVVAAALLGLFPGPGVTSIVGHAVSSGRKTALAAVAGLALGNGLAMSLSLAGVGTLLAASAAAFTAIKWIGALYLIGLGLLTLWKSRGRMAADAARPAPVSPRAAFMGNVAIATFHP